MEECKKQFSTKLGLLGHFVRKHYHESAKIPLHIELQGFTDKMIQQAYPTIPLHKSLGLPLGKITTWLAKQRRSAVGKARMCGKYPSLELEKLYELAELEETLIPTHPTHAF